MCSCLTKIGFGIFSIVFFQWLTKRWLFFTYFILMLLFILVVGWWVGQLMIVLTVGTWKTLTSHGAVVSFWRNELTAPNVGAQCAHPLKRPYIILSRSLIIPTLKLYVITFTSFAYLACSSHPFFFLLKSSSLMLICMKRKEQMMTLRYQWKMLG